MNKTISAIDAKKLREKNPSAIFLDVREKSELTICKINHSIHFPLSLISENFNLLPKNIPIIVYCHHGIRSMKAVNFLLKNGFDKVFNLDGGINAWSIQIDPSIPKY